MQEPSSSPAHAGCGQLMGQPAGRAGAAWLRGCLILVTPQGNFGTGNQRCHHHSSRCISQPSHELGVSIPLRACTLQDFPSPFLLFPLDLKATLFMLEKGWSWHENHLPALSPFLWAPCHALIPTCSAGKPPANPADVSCKKQGRDSPRWGLSPRTWEGRGITGTCP